ncbi:MAG: tRNA-dihydrouridine synthase family protein [Lachnospiraceae bacterium]|nr:tRNA-dihydrouridine synthase family protein [Lachnospiraceae bacterium]
MKFYFAPFEGISWYVYRNLFAKHFEGPDCYVTPFIAPNQKREIRNKDKQDVLPKHNEGLHVIPQIIGNRADEWIHTARQLQDMGYEEVNLNLGCPSNTVAAKGKGAGFLARPAQLKEFLEEIFNELSDMDISVKTRVGKQDPEEFYELLDLFNSFPIKCLMIHPRIQKEFYRGAPHREQFAYAYEHSKNPVCYNGDIFRAEDYKKLIEDYPKLDEVMLGRGLLANPFLLEEIKGTGKPDKKRLRAFHDELFVTYQELLFSEEVVLHKMKELWHYMICCFSHKEEYDKRIRKAKTLMEYKGIISALFAEGDLVEGAGYQP